MHGHSELYCVWDNRPSIAFYIFDFLEIAERILTKVNMKQHGRKPLSGFHIRFHEWTEKHGLRLCRKRTLLCFWDGHINKDDSLGLWFADAILTSPLQPQNGF